MLMLRVDLSDWVVGNAVCSILCPLIRPCIHGDIPKYSSVYNYVIDLQRFLTYLLLMVKHDWVCIHLHDLSYGWYQKHRSIERHSSVRYCKNTIWRFSLACCIGTGNETDNERKHWYMKPTILKIFESQLHNIIWLSRSSAFLTTKFSKQFLWNREPVLEWNMQILFICFRCTFLHGDIQYRKKMPEKANARMNLSADCQ